MRQHSWKLLMGLVCSVSSWMTAAAMADEESGSATDRELLDDLDQLDADLIEAGDDDGLPTDSDETETSTDDQLLRDLDAGEDIELRDDGQPAADEELGGEVDPLTRIGRKMRKLETLLEKKTADNRTGPLQEQVVEDLAELIKQIRQNQQQQKHASSKKKSQKQQGSRSKIRLSDNSRPGKPGDRESKKPADNSEERQGKPKTAKVDKSALEALIKEIWGHLPEKERRELMRQFSEEEPIPGHEVAIEKYFRRLAEEDE